MRKKTSCLGCKALTFNRSLGMMDCSLGFQMLSRYPQQPMEPCPKPRTTAAWAKAYVAKCKYARDNHEFKLRVIAD